MKSVVTRIPDTRVKFLVHQPRHYLVSRHPLQALPHLDCTQQTPSLAPEDDVQRLLQPAMLPLLGSSSPMLQAVSAALRPALLGAALGGSGGLRQVFRFGNSNSGQQSHPIGTVLGCAGSLLQARGLLWSIEREKGHVYKDTKEIINEPAINSALERTKKNASDPAAIAAILDAAKDRSFLTNFTPGRLRALRRPASPGLAIAGLVLGQQQLLCITAASCTIAFAHARCML